MTTTTPHPLTQGYPLPSAILEDLDRSLSYEPDSIVLLPPADAGGAHQLVFRINHAADDDLVPGDDPERYGRLSSRHDVPWRRGPVLSDAAWSALRAADPDAIVFDRYENGPQVWEVATTPAAREGRVGCAPDDVLWRPTEAMRARVPRDTPEASRRWLVAQATLAVDALSAWANDEVWTLYRCLSDAAGRPRSTPVVLETCFGRADSTARLAAYAGGAVAMPARVSASPATPAATRPIDAR